MSVFKEFEREVVRRLAEESSCVLNIEGILDDSEFVSLEHTGVGYFLTVAHPSLPEERNVWDGVFHLGQSDGGECGFIVFIEKGTLCLECYSWCEEGIPEDYRNGEVSVEVVKTNQATKSGKIKWDQKVRIRDWIAVLFLPPLAVLALHFIGKAQISSAHYFPDAQEQLEGSLERFTLFFAPASVVFIGYLIGGAGRWKWSIITSYIEGLVFALVLAFGFATSEGPLWKEFVMACLVGGIVSGIMWRRKALKESHQ